MDAERLLKIGTVGALCVGIMVLAPAPALATNMSTQQAILLAHLNLGGGLFFTTNYVFTASEGSNTTVNVKCFNDVSQRIGPAAGVNVQLNATGQSAQHTPTTLGVASQPLFTGLGWCWGNNTSSALDYNVQITIGVTSDLTPGGILNSPSSTFVAANTGLAESSNRLGGIPYYTTSGGALNFLFVVNPIGFSRTLTLQLFDAGGVQQGAAQTRSIQGRDLEVLSIPDTFGLPVPRRREASGSSPARTASWAGSCRYIRLAAR